MADVGVDPGLVRAVALLAPIAAVGGLWCWRRPGRRLAAGALLATVWNLPALLGLHLAAQSLGWWHYEAAGGLVAGMPVDLLLGWLLLWGAIPVLAFPAGRLAVPAAALLLVDLTFMPLGAPVVVLGDAWLLGEAVGLGVALVPALLLGRWTAADRRLPARAAMQAGLAAALLLWVLPLLVLETPWGLAPAVRALPGPLPHLATGALLLLALPGVAAVHEFAERGRGTPVPLDPPARLVRSGPYAYVRNPMQTSVCLLLALSAGVTGSLHLLAGSVVAVAYGAGLAWWHEGQDLGERFGPAWSAYRRSVAAWRPRWRPSTEIEPGILWVAMRCEQCCAVAGFFAAREPVRLARRPAEAHPDAHPDTHPDAHPDGRARRVAYEAAGRRWEGVAAIARALEHLHLGWALLGWAVRLPVLVNLVQLLVDAAGGGPRDLRPDPAPSLARRRVGERRQPAG